MIISALQVIMHFPRKPFYLAFVARRHRNGLELSFFLAYRPQTKAICRGVSSMERERIVRLEHVVPARH